MSGTIPPLSPYTLMAWSGKTLSILSVYITYLLQYRSVRITWQQEMLVLAYHEVMTLWTLQNITHCGISWTATNFLNHFFSGSNNEQRAHLEQRKIFACSSVSVRIVWDTNAILITSCL